MLEALVDPSVAGRRERLFGSGSAGAGARKATKVLLFLLQLYVRWPLSAAQPSQLDYIIR